MNKFDQLAAQGQSLWLDYMRRSFVESGDLQALVEQGLRGVTSNPSIFEKAIAGSQDYDSDLRELVEQGLAVGEIYEALALEDIRRAADILRPVYESSDGLDGYVSLEVDPTLAHDTQGTVSAARKLHAALGRPNIMIKVPATPAGIPAIEQLVSEGLNINVTLMFSLSQYEAVAQAYISGLEKLHESGGDLRSVASVASFFISRVDVRVDPLLRKAGLQEVTGRVGIANSKLAYKRFSELFSGERWERLDRQGARVQRLLWASTSTKDPALPDTHYVDNLIGPDTVNTLPPSTLNAFLDHGQSTATLGTDLEASSTLLEKVRAAGINLDEITDRLLKDGVDSFTESFEGLLTSIREKRASLLAGWEQLTQYLGSYEERVAIALREMEAENTLPRIWRHDHTVWSQSPDEVSNRLGWLHSPEMMVENLPDLEALVDELVAEGYTNALLLGMGGSSLAPEMFSRIFGDPDGPLPGRLQLDVLDSTDPGSVRSFARTLDPARTLYIVSTKSGGTVETLSFFKYFYNEASQALGEDHAGGHFIAITDPGSKLEELAVRYRFREIFLNDPNIGGRYSALSYFGLLPAVMVGVDASRLLDKALAVLSGCEPCVSPSQNPGARLGAVLGELALAGRDKLTFVLPASLASFGDWVEQLVAESTGKLGRGILPVVQEPHAPEGHYGPDRLFVHLRLRDDDSQDALLAALHRAGHPTVTLHLMDPYDLGGQLALWEMATAVAGARMGINPFDQPDVESAKIRAREMVQAYQESGALPDSRPDVVQGELQVFGAEESPDVGAALRRFLSQGQGGAPMSQSDRPYVAIQAFIRPEIAADEALRKMRSELLAQTGLATTTGYGPRFLHSTGQLHKGDSGRGLFLQITSEPRHEAAIPDEASRPESSMDFGVLMLAQALGDRRALEDAGRSVLRIHLTGRGASGLGQLVAALESLELGS